MDNAAYWNKIEHGWGRDMKGSDTHHARWKYHNAKWKQILLTPSERDKFYADSAKSWKAFEQACLSHRHCTIQAMCAACGFGYCEHLVDKHICLSFPVCTACDTYVQPNPNNPKCKWLISYYLGPTGLHWAEPSGQEISIFADLSSKGPPGDNWGEPPVSNEKAKSTPTHAPKKSHPNTPQRKKPDYGSDDADDVFGDVPTGSRPREFVNELNETGGPQAKCDPKSDNADVWRAELMRLNPNDEIKAWLEARNK